MRLQRLQYQVNKRSGIHVRAMSGFPVPWGHGSGTPNDAPTPALCRGHCTPTPLTPNHITQEAQRGNS